MKLRAESDQVWFWLLLKYHGGAAEIVEAEIDDPYALPDSFRVRKVTNISSMENPETTKAREAVIDKYRNQDRIAGGTRSEFEIKKWRENASAKCDREIAALPKLDTVKTATRDARTMDLDIGIQLRAGVVQFWPLPPDWIEVCEACWKRAEADADK